MQWKWEFGPASVVGLIGILVYLITLVTQWNSVTNNIDILKVSNSRIEQQVQQQTTAREAISERVIKLETTLTSLVIPSLQRIEQRQDETASNNRP